MRVIFDQQAFSLQKFGGVSRYFVELNDHLNLLEDVESRVIAPLHFNKHLFQSNPLGGIFLPKSTEVLDFNKRVRSLGKNISRFIIDRFKPDLVHETFYEPSIFENSIYPIVTTIHDLTRERLGVDLSKIEKKRAAINRADRIITVSKSTANDLINFYGVDMSMVSTIYVGVSDFFRQLPNPSLRPNNRKPFILFVGHRDGYKNWNSLILAYSNSKFLRETFDIYCFGGNKFSKSEILLIEQLGITDRIKRIVGTDFKLRDCYQEAACLVYPSIYEGFGSPVVEAMASGCPVFASGAPAILESGGNAANFFDPNSIESIIEVLEFGLCSPSRLLNMVNLGHKHSSQFTWDRTAIETLRVYKELIG